MGTDSNSETGTSCCSISGETGEMMNQCPMAKMFEEKVTKSRFKHYLQAIGFVLILLAIGILVQPKLLGWLVVIICLVLGIGLLFGAYHIGRMRPVS